MLDVPVNTYKHNKLMPLYDPSEDGREHGVNLVPSTTYARGTILGQVTTSANDVQTITVTATGGTTKLAVEYPVGNIQTTGTLAYNANAAAIQTALAALSNVGAGNVAVTGTGPFVVTFGGGLAGRPVSIMTLGTGSALTGGTWSIAHTTTGVTAGTWKTYASGNGDGSQNPSAILPYDCVTDAEGLITFGTVSTGGYWGEKEIYIDVWFGGVFKTSELVGFDANAASAMKGLLISGSVADGIYKF